MKLFAIPALLAVMLPAIAFADSPGAIDFDDLEYRTEMTTRSLDQIQEVVDEAARKQLDLIDTFTEEIESFLDTMTDIGVTVSDATRVWIQNPNDTTELKVSRAVAQVAAEGRQASQTLADLDDRIAPVIRTIRKDLAGHIDQTKADKETADATYRASVESLEIATQAMYEARDKLALTGAFDSEDFDLTPEEEDRLFKLYVDFEELEMVSNLHADLDHLMGSYLAVLEDADGHFRDIERMTQNIAYQADSYGRRFGHVGKVELVKNRLKAIADAYGEAPALSVQVSDALSKMRGMNSAMMTVVNASNALPRPAVVGEGGRRADTGGNILEIFRNFKRAVTDVAGNERGTS